MKRKKRKVKRKKKIKKKKENRSNKTLISALSFLHRRKKSYHGLTSSSDQKEKLLQGFEIRTEGKLDEQEIQGWRKSSRKSSKERRTLTTGGKQRRKSAINGTCKAGESLVFVAPSEYQGGEGEYLATPEGRTINHHMKIHHWRRILTRESEYLRQKRRTLADTRRNYPVKNAEYKTLKSKYNRCKRRKINNSLEEINVTEEKINHKNIKKKKNQKINAKNIELKKSLDHRITPPKNFSLQKYSH